MELLTKLINFTMTTISTWLGSNDAFNDISKLFQKDNK